MSVFVNFRGSLALNDFSSMHQHRGTGMLYMYEWLWNEAESLATTEKDDLYCTSQVELLQGLRYIFRVLVPVTLSTMNIFFIIDRTANRHSFSFKVIEKLIYLITLLTLERAAKRLHRPSVQQIDLHSQTVATVLPCLKKSIKFFQDIL